jgi:hypothetical protein
MSFFRIIGNGLILPGGGDVSFTHLARAEVTDADVTTVSFSGLTIANRSCLMFVLRLNHNGTTATEIQLFVNGNTTASDYDTQLDMGSGATHTLVRTSTNRIMLPTSLENGICYGIMTLTNSEWFCRCHACDDVSAVRIQDFALSDDTNSYADITSLAFTGTAADTIEIGTIIDIYALEAA